MPSFGATSCSTSSNGSWFSLLSYCSSHGRMPPAHASGGLWRRQGVTVASASSPAGRGAARPHGATTAVGARTYVGIASFEFIVPPLPRASAGLNAGWPGASRGERVRASERYHTHATVGSMARPAWSAVRRRHTGGPAASANWKSWPARGRGRGRGRHGLQRTYPSILGFGTRVRDWLGATKMHESASSPGFCFSRSIGSCLWLAT